MITTVTPAAPAAAETRRTLRPRSRRKPLPLAVLAVMLVVLALPAAAFAAVTDGPAYGVGSTAFVEGAGVAWTDPGNIGADDTSYATCTVAAQGSTYLLLARDFGFAIPATATIDGITVEIDRQSTGPPAPLRDAIVRLTKDGTTLVGDNLARTGNNWPTAKLQTVAYGGGASLWGETWTVDEINATGFGVALQAQNPNTSLERTATVDFIRVSVTWHIELTVEGAVAVDKTYDGTTAAEVDFSAATLAGALEGDDVAIGSYTASFASEDAGEDVPVTLLGLALAGADANKYAATPPADLSADITPAELTVEGAVAADKTYDGTTTAEVDFSTATLAGVVGADDVVLDASAATAAFDSKDAGTDKPVAVDGLALAGADAGNYTVAAPEGLAADITPAELTVTANDQKKPFGATFTFVGTEFTSAGLMGGDSVTAVTLQSDGAVAAASTGTYPIVASDAVGAGLGNYTIAYVDGTLTVTDVYTISTFSKPLRVRDALRFHRGASIRLAFRVRVNGALRSDVRVRMKVTNTKGFTFGPKTVKYDTLKSRYIRTFKTTSNWRLGIYTVKAYIPGGLAERTIKIRIIR